MVGWSRRALLNARVMTKIRWLAAASAFAILSVAACDVTTTGNQTTNNQPAEGAEANGLAKLARIEMHPDTSFLNQEEREVVNLLIQAANLMSEIYKRQATPDFDRLRSEVAAKNDPALLEKFGETINVVRLENGDRRAGGAGDFAASRH